MAGGSLEASEAIEERAEEASDATELIADSADETTDDTSDEAADEDGASDEDGAADEDDAADEDELTSEEVATGVTGVWTGRLKMKIRPTITATATMMMIQVLRFMGFACLVGGDDTGKFYVDALPPPVRAASNIYPSLAALSSAGVFASS